MSTEEVAPLKPISSLDVAWTESSEAPRFFALRYRHLSRAAMGKDYRVGVAIEKLAPGKQSSPAHYHIFEEEHVYLLGGTLTVRIGADTYEMKAGYYVCFPAGQKAGHSFMSSGTGSSSYLMIGERNPNDVCVYPDSNKIGVNALRTKDSIFDMSGVRNYLDGELTN
jgi:uncharacterized cupin superfamily protein